jgi:cytochrome c1
MRFKQFLLIIPVALTITAIACKAKKAATTEKAVVAPVPVAKVETATVNACPQPVTFQTLKPLLSKSCTTPGCHDAGFSKMNFTDYRILLSFAEEGEIKQHVLVRKDMPPNEKLTDAELAMIKCWIDTGMKEK